MWSLVLPLALAVLVADGVAGQRGVARGPRGFPGPTVGTDFFNLYLVDPGPFQWTAPAHTHSVVVLAWGGGGGGSSSPNANGQVVGGGAGSGAFVQATVRVKPGDVGTGFIGAPGIGHDDGTASSGGDTNMTFADGTYLSAGGGQPGQTRNTQGQALPGTGGAAVVIDRGSILSSQAVSGNDGDEGIWSSTGAVAFGGSGGTAPFGGSGGDVTISVDNVVSADANYGQNPGGGASGSFSDGGGLPANGGIGAIALWYNQ